MTQNKAVITCNLPVIGSSNGARVDACYEEPLRKLGSWELTKKGHVRPVKGKVNLSDYVLGLDEKYVEGVPVRHIDGDKLNNTRSNLNACVHPPKLICTLCQ
jgi:hypothetical protein